MGLIIDTNVFIDAEAGRFNLKNLEVFSKYGQAYISVITVSELYSGVHLAKNIEKRIRRSVFVENIISGVPVINIDTEIARIYAELYAHALEKGRRAGTNVHDLLIAATAISGDHFVVTSNIKDFNPIPGVECGSPY